MPCAAAASGGLELFPQGKKEGVHNVHTLGFGLGRTGGGLGRIAEVIGGSGGNSRAGTRFESHLGHSVFAGQGILVLFRVHSVHTLASDLMFRVCGTRIDLFGCVGERLPTADRVPCCGVSAGCSSSFVLPLGFRVHPFMVAKAAHGMICCLLFRSVQGCGLS